MRHCILLIFISLFISSCSSNNEKANNNITVTIEPLRFFTERIAGDRFSVQTMVPSGSSPETYEPTPRQLVYLSHSCLYIKIGKIGFERTWMSRLKVNAPQMKIIDSSEGIRYIKDENGIEDPHTWMSCKNARIISRNILNALLKTKNNNSPCTKKDSIYFTNNYNKLIKDINKTERSIIAKKKRNKTFIIYHPILTYFAKEFDMKQLPMEEEGREPNAKQMMQLIQTAKKDKVKTIFIQREFSPRSSMQIVMALHSEPTEINPLSYNWLEEMRNIVNDIR